MRDVQREPENGGEDGARSSAPGGTPKFGRLLLVLAFALLMIVAITFGSEAYFT